MISFHQLNDELDKHKKKSFDDVNYDKYIIHLIFFSIDNSSENLLEKIKATRQQYYFSTSSI